MKRIIFPIVLIFCLFITFFSCSNKPKKSRKPVSSISIQPNKKNYVFGEKINVSVSTKLKNGEIKNIQLFYNNTLLKESKELDFYINDLELDQLGNQFFKVIATKTDDVSNYRTQSLSVFSDIVPKNYSYQVVKTYPHLKSSFTQGLEYYDGFLYEGTGNEGFSKLMKVNLTTGHPIQSFDLDDQYFGEGITILNDKIYQLTYRAQKGFIYDLKTFALIDSFQYKSEQGWGLTNDENSLIMSNGSHHLTWLNPENLSIEKTIQVVNNQGLINNLNELEYINGSIFANVYTTNIIVEIEPTTGRVLSQINLSGLIDMYKTRNDTIDYLNGIAYDSEKDKFFVTGKWWPRLFEIKLTELK